MGNKNVEENIYNKRMDICKKCEHLKPILNSHIEQCEVCNCIMFIKARFEIFKCPIDKW